jgi:hypothetical protein
MTTGISRKLIIEKLVFHRWVHDKNKKSKNQNQVPTFGLLISTLISENQGLEKLRSVSNL